METNRIVSNPDDEVTKAASPSDPDVDGSDAGPEGAQDETQAPEEENQSQIPGDPRDPNEQQPPFKEQY